MNISEKRSSMLHGVLLIALFSCSAFYIGQMDFVTSLSLSPMIVGIVLGMLYANSLRNNLPETWVPGIQFCSKRILRIGIIQADMMCILRQMNSSMLWQRQRNGLQRNTVIILQHMKF